MHASWRVPTPRKHSDNSASTHHGGERAGNCNFASSRNPSTRARSSSQRLAGAMLSPALAALQPLGAVPHPPRGGCTRHTSLSTPSLAETRRCQWLDLEAVALKPRRHTRRRGCCCASVSGGERFSEPPGAGAPGWVQQQQAADGAASGSPAAYAAEGGGDNTFRMDAAMSLEDDMHVFGYEPQPGEKAPFGPPVLLVAGMRAEEVPRVRELLDELGGHTVKLLAVRVSLLIVWPSLYATARLTL